MQPLAPQALPASHQEMFTTMTQGHTAHPPFHVLVVDDDPDAAESLAFCLQVDGRHVRYATSGDDALALAAEQPPHLALIDIYMPGVDGNALARELRQRFGDRLVLIAVTGALKSVTLESFDHQLTKPVDFTQLQHMLDAASAQR